jgi:hypothetical protein
MYQSYVSMLGNLCLNSMQQMKPQMIFLQTLIEALKEAPESNFQRWLSNQVGLWSMRKLDWKQDGSDLMEEAEIYYQEAINTHKWGRKSHKPDVHYALKSTASEDEGTEVEKAEDESKKYQDEINALTAKLKEYTTAYTARWSGLNEVNHDKKYAWKRIPPKDGDPVIKKVHVNGILFLYAGEPTPTPTLSHNPFASCILIIAIPPLSDSRSTSVFLKNTFLKGIYRHYSSTRRNLSIRVIISHHREQIFHLSSEEQAAHPPSLRAGQPNPPSKTPNCASNICLDHGSASPPANVSLPTDILSPPRHQIGIPVC